MTYIDFGLELLLNLDKYFLSSPIEIQQKLISSVFPEKLIFDGENYRTTRKNELLELLTRIDEHPGTVSKKKALNNQDLSCMAPQVRLELTTHGLTVRCSNQLSY
jgi:site-specific DNA recombinase